MRKTGGFNFTHVSDVIYFVRYPIWGWTIEPIFAVLILSYFSGLVIALWLLKKDIGVKLSEVFKFRNYVRF